MKKKVLIAVDGSVQCRSCIQYAMNVASDVDRLHYTLLHVQRPISHYLIEEAKRHPEKKRELDLVFQKNTEAAFHLLDKLKTFMIDSGVSPDHIEVVTHPRVNGTARDIITAAEHGRFDAIVIGRRGISRLQEAFSGSVTSNLIEHSRVIPLWIVDGEVPSDRIMIAVDGSESSLRAVDHLCFMLTGNQRIVVTLFHVTQRFGDYCQINLDSTAEADLDEILVEGDRRCIDNFMGLARKRFQEAGLSEAQIRLKMVERRFNPGKAIVEEMEKEKHGTLVIGRSGIDRAFFMGSVSRYVLNKANNCALWVVT
jgi:nucleotide-binding universal stress UspA family protein